MRSAALLVVASLASAGCGGGHGETGSPFPGVACSATRPQQHAPCASWKVAGPDRVFDAITENSTKDVVGSVIPIECGAMIGWTWSTYRNAGAQQGESFKTLLAAFDGTAGPVLDHPSLDLTYLSPDWDPINLVAGPAGVSALVTDPAAGCRFLPLDASGADRGPVRTLDSGSVCTFLAAGTQSFSYLSYLATDVFGPTTPTALVTVDPTGKPVSSRLLGDPPGRRIAEELPFADGSFLLATSEANSLHEWLQGFDAQGNARSAPIVVTTGAPNVSLVATASGALAFWEGGSGMVFEPIDRTGVVTGPAQTLPLAGSLEQWDVASMPNGDVLALLVVADMSTNAWTATLQELAPDGKPRGAPSPVSVPGPPSVPLDGVALASLDGWHALLVYSSQGIHTLPMACAD